MGYIDDYGEFNMKTKLDAKAYVEANIERLIQMYDMNDDSTIEEKQETLIKYFTRFPDQIRKISLQTFGTGPNNYVLRTNNIGGVVKYK